MLLLVFVAHLDKALLVQNRAFEEKRFLEGLLLQTLFNLIHNVGNPGYFAFKFLAFFELRQSRWLSDGRGQAVAFGQCLSALRTLGPFDIVDEMTRVQSLVEYVLSRAA
jgi:hypothetical protein